MFSAVVPCRALQSLWGNRGAMGRHGWKRMGAAIALGLGGALAALAAEQSPPTPIPGQEAFYAPTAPRLTAVHATAQREGWAGQATALRSAALLAYEKNRLAAAEAWYHAYRWAALFGESDAAFIPRWVDAVNAVRAGHANMSTRYEPRDRLLGADLGPELEGWLLGNAAFSAEFFTILKPVDYVPGVFQILGDLYRRDPARFKTYASLALAIAVVHDVPPPPFWPHAQVSGEALPRRLPAPADAFAWWVRQDQLGRTYHRLGRLGADDLKFVIDAAAPFSELEWAQQAAAQPLAELANAYTMIRYRQDRAAANAGMWPGNSYTLSDILTAGGICADQAYFATQVGKARGVPTLLFYGAGNDARHAWFGYLDANRKWQLDAGRYAEQRFVTGYARDPQTWLEFSDHELQFLTERFRELASYRQSRVHAAFAEEYLAAGNTAAAVAAARKAVTYERRNQAGWETLIVASRKEGRDAKAIENILREAALAFQRYPDLEASYVNRTAESLRARGQISEADAEIRRIALKNQGNRGDLSVQQAREILLQALKTQPLAGQVRSYNTVVDNYGRGAGVGFFDEVVVAFVDHLLQQGQPAEATRAVERARRTLKVEPNSQLEGDFARLLLTIKNSK